MGSTRRPDPELAPEPASDLPEQAPESQPANAVVATGSPETASSITVPEAVRALDSVGFVDHANLPHDGRHAHLVVGLRPTPTLRHFDPELVRYWATRVGRGEQLEISLEGVLPGTSEFSWGPIEIADRHGVRNTYLGFGGQLWLDLVSDLLVARFVSSAPILRRGGHSQVFDQGAANLGAFIGRLMIAIDYRPGFEEQLSGATPVTRYAAFVEDFLARIQASAPLSLEDRSLITLLESERSRLRLGEPADWIAGLDLLAAANLPS